MLNKRIRNKKVLSKVIALVLIGLSIIGLITYQHSKINSLESNLNKIKIEQSIETTTETEMGDKIKTKFNELKTYKVYEETINFKHVCNYSEKTLFGLHKRYKLSATANVYFQMCIDLDKAEIKEDKNTITIVLKNPYIDKSTVHRVSNSFHIIQSETDSNLLCNKDTSRKAQLEWEDSLDNESYESISNYYNTDIERVRNITKKEVEELINTFVKDKKINIEIIDVQ